MKTKKLLAVFGSVLLFVGVFTPLISLPIVGSINYFQNGKGDGIFILVLAVVSLILALTNCYEGLWITAGGSLAVLTFTFVQFQMTRQQILSVMDKDLSGNPFAGLARLAVDSVQIQWGWALLLVGVGMVLAGAVLKDERPSARPLFSLHAKTLAIVGVVALVALGTWGVSQIGHRQSASMMQSNQAKSPTSGSEHGTQPDQTSTADNEWLLNESTNKMDNTPEVALQKSGSDGSSLTIRCTEHKTEAYVNTKTVVDGGAVRVRFDQSAPERQGWERSTDYRALFAPDAMTFARTLAQARTFLFEFTPFQQRERAVSFDVSGLDAKLTKISDACDWDAVDKSRAEAKIADAALRERISHYVHQCDSSGAFAGDWCWSDPDDVLYSTENPAPTKEAALEEAVRIAREGLAFKSKSSKRARVVNAGSED